MIRPIIIILSQLLLLIALPSCSQRDIVYDDGVAKDISVKFIWDNAQDAEVEGMSLYFFPESDGAKLWRFDIAGMAGGRVELPVGTYSLIAVNNDNPNVKFSTPESYGSFSAIARTSGEGDLTAPTGMLYGASVSRVSVTPCGVIYVTPEGETRECPRGIVSCCPDSMSTRYTVILPDVKNAEKARSVKARLKGVATKLLIAGGKSSGRAGATRFSLERGGKDSALFRGETTSFSPPPGEPSCQLYIEAEMQDGKIYSKGFDVTSQVANSPYPHNVIIVLKGVVLPDGDTPPPPDNPDVGLDVGVDGWVGIEIDYDTSDPGSYEQ